MNRHLTVRDAADLLNCSKSTIVEAIKRRQLRAYNISTSEVRATYRIDPAELQAFIERKSLGEPAKMVIEQPATMPRHLRRVTG